MRTTPEQLDNVTIRLIFALRDSLTDDGPSFIDFWSGGRAISALEAAAAGASTGAEAVSLAAKKLQIPQIASRQAKTVTECAAIIDQDYAAWAAHITRNAVYILALADVQRLEKKAARAAEKEALKPEALPF
jgi:hypothetical protein